MRWPFTTYATGFFLGLSALLFALGWGLAKVTGVPALAFVPAPVWLFCAWFFRDPERLAPGDALDLVAPADGLVADIVTVVDPELGVPCVRVGIFLSVFDVHVNRAPCAGRVERRQIREGGFLDARHPRASEDNRAATLVLRRPDGRALAVRQITGLIARRIVCPVAVGDTLQRGQRYGMIRFGSRTELVVPQDEVETLLVKVGDRVAGGRSLVLRCRAARGGGAA